MSRVRLRSRAFANNRGPHTLARKAVAGLTLLAVVLLAAAAHGRAGSDAQLAAARDRPNIVLITTDDQSANLLWVMHRTRRVITDQGTKFSRFFSSFPLCCPTRATWITGQYAHNHGVIDNRERNGGGYAALREPSAVLPAWLGAVGYETAFAGKWLHDYATTKNAPGWDIFQPILHSGRYYNFEMLDSNGGTIRYGDRNEDYVTDVLTNRFAVPFIREHAASPSPFFLHVAYTAPHWGSGRNDKAGRRCATPKPFRFERARPKPALRHADAYRKAPMPRPPSFNERHLSDKPAAVANKPWINAKSRQALAERYRCELATMLAVDEGVARINHALIDAGIENDTVMIFTTDQGYMTGEHRIRGGKVQPYEEALRVPFLIKGPDVPVKGRTFETASAADLAPTILDLAHANATGRPLDGISVLPALRQEGLTDRAILLEAKRSGHQEKGGSFSVRSWVGVRTRRYTYIERRSADAPNHQAANDLPIGAGDTVAAELYDDKQDPYQLRSRDHSRRYAEVRETLAALLSELEHCEGSDCVVDAPVPDPKPRARRGLG